MVDSRYTQSLVEHDFFEDDTGPIISTIDRFKYPTLGKPIVEEGRIGDWYLVKGIIKQGFRKNLC